MHWDISKYVCIGQFQTYHQTQCTLIFDKYYMPHPCPNTIDISLVRTLRKIEGNFLLSCF